MKFSKNNFSKKERENSKGKSNSNKYSKSYEYERGKVKRNYSSNKSDSANSKKFDDYKKNNSINSKINSRNNNQSRSKSNRKNLTIESLTDNKLKDSQFSVRNKNLDDWIWGKHAVFSCLNSERPINRIWCTSDIYSSEKFYLILKDLKSKGTLIEEVDWSRLTQLTLGGVHQGVALQLASSNTVTLDELINSSKSKSSRPIIVALDGITDPHNMGAIIRSAEAFDCKGIIIPQRRSVGLTGTVGKVAAGALEHIPVSRVVNLNRAIEELKKSGFIVVGLSGDAHLSIEEFDEKSPLVLIIGSENKGISLLTQKNCDYMLKIPLKGKTPSLNASVAAAISIYYFHSM